MPNERWWHKAYGLATGRHALRTAVLVALFIRLAVASFLYFEQMHPEYDHFSFGFEEGRVHLLEVQE
jgi:hypothetical protein